jgi:CopG family nickel-responsive transcriptional regulator
MSDLVRFGVSIENGLLDEFDTLITERGYSNRSEAIRDLIRGYTAEREWEEGGEAAGGIVFVYDHHQRELSERLVDIQHDALDIVVSNLHVHLSHHHCLEVIVVRGRVGAIRSLADQLRSQKGVTHCSVARVATG